jgi:hypothetical protein
MATAAAYIIAQKDLWPLLIHPPIEKVTGTDIRAIGRLGSASELAALETSFTGG